MGEDQTAERRAEAERERARVDAEAARASAVMSFGVWLEWLRSHGGGGSARSPADEAPASRPRLPPDPVPPRSATVIAYMSHLFRHSDASLSGYDANKVAAILGELVGTAGEIRLLHDVSVLEKDRVACAEARGDFLATFMADRVAPVLGHRSERSDRPLQARCYMWWDGIPLRPRPGEPDARAVDEALLRAMARQLGSPSIAVQESGLHGLGHWQLDFPEMVASAIDTWLAAAPPPEPRLRAYAAAARKGHVL